jgi:hypothetical protein
LEKDRFGDMLNEGERAGVSSDGDGEADRVGEPFAHGSFSGRESPIFERGDVTMLFFKEDDG